MKSRTDAQRACDSGDLEAGGKGVYIDSRVQRPVSAGRRAQARGRRARRAARPGPPPHRLRTPPRQPGDRPKEHHNAQPETFPLQEFASREHYYSFPSIETSTVFRYNILQLIEESRSKQQKALAQSNKQITYELPLYY
ncbi:unnamed protein product [Euphydryas editha]|uniref:Uncharacterized protein n=1 Tax=Euphydryas editha TaxID=104508 RepID=A0AAU9THP9_EUPED|nr:unnamed protein product [Euphydryas editha]